MSKPIDGKGPAGWGKHLRKVGKRLFWRALRAKQKRETKA